RESLLKRELRGLKKGHPIDLLMKENEWILKKAEILNLYAQAVLNATDEERVCNCFDALGLYRFL
ncbi:MAG: hypothetical protein QW700_07035, partial [Desulfurococcaceae archaeon]